MSVKKLDGKIAVVTGASKGIGASIAKHYGAEGAVVVVNYASDREGAERVVGEIEAGGGRAKAVGADLSKPEEIVRMFEVVKGAYGRVDVLVNNAGIYEFGVLEEIHPEHFHRQFNVNVLGLLLATKEAVALFPGSGGSVIHISSLISTARMPGAAVYSGTKGAVDAITRSLAAELGPRGIRVNAINPGMVETEGVHRAGFIGTEMEAQMKAATPLGRLGQPQDIATMAVFLASEDASWISGETLVIAGGSR